MTDLDRLEHQVTKLDHFYDVQRQMHAIVLKREKLQRKAGQKLVHCKLKGHEDIADEFKRLIDIKSKATYFAVKEAQMKPLIKANQLLPSKAVQLRIESNEREIFALLSTENKRSDSVQNTDVKIDMTNCLNVLTNKYDNLQMRLEELGRVEEELGEKDHYTEEGFHQRDVELQESLQKEKEDLETELSLVERNVQQSQAGVDDSNIQLKEAEGRVTSLLKITSQTKEEIARLNKEHFDARISTSTLREARNEILCKVILQRRALNKDAAAGEMKVQATESLHSRKSDIEREVSEKRDKLKMLKKRQAELDAEEKVLETAEQAKLAQLAKVKQDNAVLDDKIAGIRECNAALARDLETCLEDVSSSRDEDCTIWRDRALKNIFSAGLLDVNLIKNVSFSNKEKYKYPQEQYQIVQALKPELGMLQAGISDLQDRIYHLKCEITGLNNKSKGVAKHRTVKQEELKNTENLVARATTKLARLEHLLATTNQSTHDQMCRLEEIIPHTNLLETMDINRKHELLGPILLKIEAARLKDDAITQYNTMKTDILDRPDSHPQVVAYEFLVRDLKYQLELEDKLERQLAQIKGHMGASGAMRDKIKFFQNMQGETR